MTELQQLFKGNDPTFLLSIVQVKSVATGGLLLLKQGQFDIIQPIVHQHCVCLHIKNCLWH